MADLPPIVSYDGVAGDAPSRDIAALANRLNAGAGNWVVDIPVEAGSTSTDHTDERFGPHRVALIPIGCPVTVLTMGVGTAHVVFPAAAQDGFVSVVVVG